MIRNFIVDKNKMLNQIIKTKFAIKLLFIIPMVAQLRSEQTKDTTLGSGVRHNFRRRKEEGGMALMYVAII